jgi:YfiH family protein
MDFILATSTKADGNMSVSWGPEAEVAENRKRFLAKSALKPEDCAVMDLEHSDGIEVVKEGDGGKIFKVDALMTAVPGLALFLMTADCFPLAYHDPVKGVLALAHLGWKSTDLGLSGKVVERMMKEFESNPNDIRVFIGPGIHRESYLVQDPSQQNDIRWEPYLEEAMGFMKIDLIGFNLNALTEAGVPRESISISPENTAVSPEYLSHFRAVRTGEPEGRFATIVGLG